MAKYLILIFFPILVYGQGEGTPLNLFSCNCERSNINSQFNSKCATPFIYYHEGQELKLLRKWPVQNDTIKFYQFFPEVVFSWKGTFYHFLEHLPKEEYEENSFQPLEYEVPASMFDGSPSGYSQLLDMDKDGFPEIYLRGTLKSFGSGGGHTISLIRLIDIKCSFIMVDIQEGIEMEFFYRPPSNMGSADIYKKPFFIERNEIIVNNIVSTFLDPFDTEQYQFYTAKPGKYIYRNKKITRIN